MYILTHVVRYCDKWTQTRNRKVETERWPGCGVFPRRWDYLSVAQHGPRSTNPISWTHRKQTTSVKKWRECRAHLPGSRCHMNMCVRVCAQSKRNPVLLDLFYIVYYFLSTMNHSVAPFLGTREAWILFTKYHIPKRIHTKCSTRTDHTRTTPASKGKLAF